MYVYMTFSYWNEIILSILLGIVQGITEFLPISSTAHLRLISELLVQKDIGLSVSNIIQFGTLIAIVQYFWSDLKNLFFHIIATITSNKRLNEFWKNIMKWLKGDTNFEAESTNFNDILLAQITLATIPIIIFALVMRDTIELLREDIHNIAYFLLAGGVLIVISEIVHKKKQNKPKPMQMTPWEVLLIGLFQCLAVFPGISRSGSALAGGLFLGRDRQKSVRFSFLLSIPTLLLAGIYDLFKTFKEILANNISILPSQSSWQLDTISPSVLSIVIAFLLAYLVGLACLRWLLKYLATNDSRLFIIYRLMLASSIIFFVA